MTYSRPDPGFRNAFILEQTPDEYRVERARIMRWLDGDDSAAFAAGDGPDLDSPPLSYSADVQLQFDAAVDALIEAGTALETAIETVHRRDIGTVPVPFGTVCTGTQMQFDAAVDQIMAGDPGLSIEAAIERAARG